MADRVGQQLGNYRLLRVLGQGAFASVYLGEHQHLERSAAIKVLHARIEPTRYESFRREARTIAQLDHPHIIGVYDFGIQDQTPYLVMEYTQGGTLRERYPKGNRLSHLQIVTYVKQIAAALNYAHQQHVIHRDIKPENILLNIRQEVVLSDFGIAVMLPALDSLSMQGPAGTPPYMAPEQMQGKPCAASDQYALGVMVYEWLCGELPFHGSLFEVFNQHLHKPPPSLCARVSSLPPAVENIVLCTLAKEPQQRFVSVADFASALEEAFFATQPLHLRSSDEATQPRDLHVQRIDNEHELLRCVSPQLVTPSQTPPKPTKPSLTQTNRQRLLRRVRSFWITGVFTTAALCLTFLALAYIIFLNCIASKVIRSQCFQQREE